MEMYTFAEIAEIMGVKMGKVVMASSRADVTATNGAFTQSQTQLIINEIKEYL